jgi:hypothetical protein
VLLICNGYWMITNHQFFFNQVDRKDKSQ